MGMKLIDGGRLLIDYCIENCGGIPENQEICPKCYTARMIADAPVIDAVFVVRCGKCKFAEKDGIHQVSLKCIRFKTGQYTHRVKPDDFCSYGERREGQ